MTHIHEKLRTHPFFVTFVVSLGLIGSNAVSLDVEAAEAVPVVETCEALTEVDFTGIEDAATQVTDARMVAATGNVPAHCLVQGYVSPNVGVRLHLPAAGEWNGNFLEASLGGYGGSTLAMVSWCEEAMRRGYACLTHDTGHSGWNLRASWAYNNLQAEFDYGIRGHYVAALAGKALIEHYYDSAPKYSYHVGCSGGGKQGLVEAQRFPWTFDGILAMEPSNVTATGVVIHWNALVTHDENGKLLFTDDDLDVLHQGALDACDTNDGLKDGVIGGDPRSCNFDPRVLACKAGQSSGCLSAVQVQAAQKVYEGPVTSDGEKLSQYFPWYPALPGSERGEYFTRFIEYKETWWRFMGFDPDPGPSWQASDFDFDRDYKRMGTMDAVVNGYSNPDLRNYKQAGGKLMVVQGWEDSGLPGPQVSVDYYEMAERIIGDRETTQDFYRLFMIPGRSHCHRGDGASSGDFLSYLEDWVEKGEAPDMMIGYHPDNESRDRNYDNSMKANTSVPEKYKFSRPHYPYPQWAKYRGKGDPNDYRNFEAVDPESQ
jgi:feruloyl esterase